jgi:hypothetical protein
MLSESARGRLEESVPIPKFAKMATFAAEGNG